MNSNKPAALKDQPVKARNVVAHIRKATRGLMAGLRRGRGDGRADRAPRQLQLMAISEINVRNQFRGSAKEIIVGPVVSEVDVETASGIVTTVAMALAAVTVRTNGR